MGVNFDRIKYFKDCVFKYIDFFDLNDFEIMIDSLNDDSIRGRCLWHCIVEGAQQLTIYYSTNWIKQATKEEIKSVAFHEVCEGLLSEMQEIARYRYIKKREIYTAVHRVIRRLENKVLPLIK